MIIHFGDTLRRLRRERNITQEQLANVLHVSYQAVSKWERGESYPDLTMIPVLTEYFGVTADELLGSNKAANEERVLKFLEDFKANKHTWLNNAEDVKSLLAEMPMDHRIRLAYLECLLNDVSTEVEQFEMEYGVIRDYCTDDDIRMRAKRMLCLMYERHGRKEDFYRTLNELPVELSDCRTIVATYLMKSENNGEQSNIEACHVAITELIRLLYETVSWLFYQEPQKATDEYVEAALTMLKILNSIYPDGDYGKNYICIIRCYGFLGAWYAINRDFEKAFEYLYECAELSVKHDGLPQKTAHTSLLVRGHVFDKTYADNDFLSGEKSMREHVHHLLTKIYLLPVSFKSDMRFERLLEILNA